MLGAYERGERAISVPRLQRLAKFYNVPVDRLLPGDVAVDGGEVIDLDDDAEASRRVLPVVAGTNLYLTQALDRSSTAALQSDRVLALIGIVDDVRASFADLRYWLTDLSVSLLTQSERNADADAVVPSAGAVAAAAAAAAGAGDAFAFTSPVQSLVKFSTVFGHFA